MSPRENAGKRLTRLFAVLMLLAERRTISLEELASTFELDAEKVVSELELAACCGLPPFTPDVLMEVSVSGDSVTAQLDPALARPRRLSPQAVLDLVATAKAMLGMIGGDGAEALESGIAKVEAAFGERYGSVEVDVERLPGTLGKLNDAVSRGRQVTINYYSHSKGTASVRNVDPVAVASIGGRWYLDAYCHVSGAPRRFRVSRILSAGVEETRCCKGLHGLTPGVPLDPQREFLGSQDGLMVTLRFAGEGAAERVRALRDTLYLESVEEAGDGTVTVRLPVAGRPFLERLLLRLGASVSVVEPPEWRSAGAEAARHLLQRYA